MTISGVKLRVGSAGLALVALLSVGCTDGERRLEGPTMGTQYHMIWYGGPSAEAFQTEANRVLEEVNSQMSTYLKDSVLSRFNRNSSTEWLPVPPALAKVVTAAQEISVVSGGAFDVTVMPLVNLWGFGPKGKVSRAPKPEALKKVRAHVGYQKLGVRSKPPGLKKEHPDLSVDLSAIAKGYGVDALGEALEKAGVTRYFVEVGGEVRTRGAKANEKSWTVGIERPEAGGRAVQRVLHVRDASIATSGDYRNYFEGDGVRYSHTVDPRTGRPISHRLASVTVVAETCMEADGLATALLVLGEEQGMRLARDRGWAVYMLVRQGPQGFEERVTDAFYRKVSKVPGIAEPGGVE